MSLGTAPRTRRVYDDALLMHDTATAIAATDVFQVDGADKILDLGSADAIIRADWIIDVSAIEIASNDEVYRFILQGSTSATFASVIANVAMLELGALEVIDGDQDSTIGRYVVPFTNIRNTDSFRYLRGSVVIAGAIATGVIFKSWIARGQMP